MPHLSDFTKICRHHTPRAPECEAGVNYAGLADSLVLKIHEAKQICMGRIPGCPLYQPWTPVEIAAQEQEKRDYEAKCDTVRAAVLVKTTGKKGVWGFLPSCPACGKDRLWYAASGWDANRIEFRCLTDTCVNFKP
jgi:hypothetical protein